MDNTCKQKNCGSTNLHYSILIEVEKFTIDQDLFFFPFEGKLAYQAFFLLENHDLISIDVKVFNFEYFTIIIIGCKCLLGIENLAHFAFLIIFALPVQDFINACYLVI
jgi:hypothetical protein